MEERVVTLEVELERYLPYMFSLQFVLGSLQLLDALRVVYYPLIHGATRIMRFELGVSLAWPLVILLGFWTVWVIKERNLKLVMFPAVALVVLPFLGLEAFISIASLQAVVAGLWYRRDISQFLRGAFLLLCGIEGLALIHWIVFVPLGWPSPLEGVAGVETGLFYLAAYAVPLLILPLLFMWLLKPLMEWGTGRKWSIGDLSVGEDDVRWSHVLLVFSLGLGIIAALFPFMPAVNPDGRSVGVDYRHYVEWAEIVQSDRSQAFNLSSGSRPLIMLFINGLQTISGYDAAASVRYSPVYLIPLLTLAAFYLAREMFNDVRYGAWAAFFTVCGIQVTVGMYSYFLTNWLGLSITFFSLGFFFRSLRRQRRIDLLLASLMGGLLVFAHPWTFDQFFVTTIVMFGLVWYKARVNQNDNGEVKAFLIYLISMGIAELVKMLLLGGVGGISASSTLIEGSSGFLDFWYNSIFSFRLLYGGLSSFSLLWGLGIMGVFLLRKGDVPEFFFILFVALTSLLFLVGDETIKSRLVFNVPIGIFASFGFHFILSKIRIKNDQLIFTSYIMLSMITYLFRSLANIV